MIGASFLRHSYVQDALEQVMQGILRTKNFIYLYLLDSSVGQRRPIITSLRQPVLPCDHTKNLQ